MFYYRMRACQLKRFEYSSFQSEHWTQKNLLQRFLQITEEFTQKF